MKYKVGDKVQIKSLDWYNKYKNEDGDVECGEFNFVEGMKKFCSETFIISEDVGDGYLMLEDYHGYVWTDEMIDCLVERNGKTYPYKIGDRVVLKGNNRCATITDLKYNSWGNLSYYIKIDNDKNISVDYPTELLLPYDNKIEELVEEDIKPKFKVGDILFYRGETSGYLKVEEIREENGEIRYYETSRNIYLVENDPDVFADKVCSVETEETKSEDELLDDYEELTDRAFKGGYEKCKSDIELNGFQLPEGYQFVDENGNVINAKKIVLEKKKKEYPKTYEGCCKVMGINHTNDLDICEHCDYKTEITFYEDSLLEKIETLYRLIVCRDAYWKLYGEEMGLGKPWEPDWDDEKQDTYGFYNEVKYTIINSALFVFPTAEMRNAFRENFGSDIEFCKKL